MKTGIFNITIAIIAFITLVLLLSHSTLLTGKMARHKTSAVCSDQGRPAIPGHSYGEVTNALFTASGR